MRITSTSIELVSAEILPAGLIILVGVNATPSQASLAATADRDMLANAAGEHDPVDATHRRRDRRRHAGNRKGELVEYIARFRRS